LARKVIFRSTTSGRKKESEKDRWLLARMAGPSSGMCSMPSTWGVYSVLRAGPTITCFISE
jgi:hypothetical protein